MKISLKTLVWTIYKK